MPVPNFLTYYNEIKHEIESQPYIVSGNGVLNRVCNTWALGLPANTAPTTAVALGVTSNNAFPLPTVSGTRRLKLIGGSVSTLTAGGVYMLIDILSHQGGLSGTTTTAQTTNLPTAALTRYTDGKGVMIGLTVYTQIGATLTTAIVTYTNQAGTGSRVSPLFPIGGTNYREANRMILVPLQYGDTGVRSVENVDLTATTGTAGAFGVTLFKPLAMFAVDEIGKMNDCDFVTGRLIGGIADVTGACLVLATISSSNATITSCMRVQVVETDN